MLIQELTKTEGYRVVGFKGQINSMFTSYTDTPVLKQNMKYTFQVKLKGQEIETITFTTKVDPLLSTIKKVRLETGEFLMELSDEDILLSLYQNSKDVKEIGSTEDLEDDELTLRAKYEKVWVLYRTCYDLIYSVYLTKSQRYGVFSKNIGDMKISNEYKVPYLTDIIEKFKKKMEQAEEQLEGVSEGATISSFVKGSSNYSYSERGSF